MAHRTNPRTDGTGLEADVGIDHEAVPEAEVKELHGERGFAGVGTDPQANRVGLLGRVAGPYSGEGGPGVEVAVEVTQAPDDLGDGAERRLVRVLRLLVARLQVHSAHLACSPEQ